MNIFWTMTFHCNSQLIISSSISFLISKCQCRSETIIIIQCITDSLKSWTKYKSVACIQIILLGSVCFYNTTTEQHHIIMDTNVTNKFSCLHSEWWWNKHIIFWQSSKLSIVEMDSKYRNYKLIYIYFEWTTFW